MSLATRHNLHAIHISITLDPSPTCDSFLNPRFYYRCCERGGGYGQRYLTYFTICYDVGPSQRCRRLWSGRSQFFLRWICSSPFAWRSRMSLSTSWTVPSSLLNTTGADSKFPLLAPQRAYSSLLFENWIVDKKPEQFKQSRTGGSCNSGPDFFTSTSSVASF